MEVGRVGNNIVGACPYCDQLFHHQIPARDKLSGADELDLLTAMYERHLASVPACQAKKDAAPSLLEAAEKLRPCFQKADKERLERLANHPENGKHGYWRVSGVRHDAITKATTAQEAVDKCSEIVGSWEGPEAEFIGEELPDVF